MKNKYCYLSFVCLLFECASIYFIPLKVNVHALEDVCYLERR